VAPLPELRAGAKSQLRAWKCKEGNQVNIKFPQKKDAVPVCKFLDFAWTCWMKVGRIRVYIGAAIT
jgi:hypothetical protein